MDFFSTCILTFFTVVGIVIFSKIIDHFFQSDDPWKDSD
jgi:hypothetical protein